MPEALTIATFHNRVDPARDYIDAYQQATEQVATLNVEDSLVRRCQPTFELASQFVRMLRHQGLATVERREDETRLRLPKVNYATAAGNTGRLSLWAMMQPNQTDEAAAFRSIGLTVHATGWRSVDLYKLSRVCIEHNVHGQWLIGNHAVFNGFQGFYDRIGQALTKKP